MKTIQIFFAGMLLTSYTCHNTTNSVEVIHHLMDELEPGSMMKWTNTNMFSNEISWFLGDWELVLCE